MQTKTFSIASPTRRPCGALAEQQAEIDSFRSRAGLLLSSAAITTSFLGAHSFDGGSLTATSWLALLAFIGAAAISLAILWPHPWSSAPIRAKSSRPTSRERNQR